MSSCVDSMLCLQTRLVIIGEVARDRGGIETGKERMKRKWRKKRLRGHCVLFGDHCEGVIQKYSKRKCFCIFRRFLKLHPPSLSMVAN